MRKAATLAATLAALTAAMVLGPSTGAAAQSAPGGPADEQYCTPAEEQYGECDDDVTIIVAPPAQPDAPLLGGDETIPGMDAIAGTDDASETIAPSAGVPPPANASTNAPAANASVANASVAGASAAGASATASSTAGAAPSGTAPSGESGVAALPDTGGMRLPGPAAGAGGVLLAAAALLRLRNATND